MYKEGDKVVYIGENLIDQVHGKVLTVDRVYSKYLGEYLIVTKESMYSMTYDEIVLEEIYNSPLYKALNEEEN